MSEAAYEADPAVGDGCVREETGDPARSEPRAPAVRGPQFTLQPDGDRVVVAVRGELDLDACERLAHVLRSALAEAADGVDLDLGEVDFCDCSALNALLGARERGLEQGKTVALRAAGPVVARLLALTATDTLFTAPAPTPDGPRHPDGVEQQLRIEVVQLRRAMETRPAIDLARGILMASFTLSADDAWRVLVEASQHTNTKLHQLAGELVAAVQGSPPAEDVQEKIAAAVAKVRSEPPPDDDGTAHPDG
ncbi:ANTAR domain-containing protein [Streptomyces sp. NPDC002566]|uniref:ANTAR domain-containing protein n=1 Tax=Streptomyces sp. NPDC002566 TaxID=3364650 RepID=UPI0036832002